MQSPLGPEGKEDDYQSSDRSWFCRITPISSTYVCTYKDVWDGVHRMINDRYFQVVEFGVIFFSFLLCSFP